MKTINLLMFLILLFSGFIARSQDNEKNNDQIICKDRIIKCEIVAITKEFYFYRENPDKNLYKIEKALVTSYQNNPVPNLEALLKEPVACFDVEGMCGYMSIRGDIIIPATFDNAENFSEGLACAKGEKSWGFIDITGTWIIQPKYERVEAFSYGYARVKSGGLWGVIDKSGQWIIEPKYKRLWDFVKIK
jgi:hypothetical protein